jgi:hypothetical protein
MPTARVHLARPVSCRTPTPTPTTRSGACVTLVRTTWQTIPPPRNKHNIGVAGAHRATELITAQQVCMTAHQMTVQAAEAKAIARPLALTACSTAYPPGRCCPARPPTGSPHSRPKASRCQLPLFLAPFGLTVRTALPRRWPAMPTSCVSRRSTSTGDKYYEKLDTELQTCATPSSNGSSGKRSSLRAWEGRVGSSGGGSGASERTRCRTVGAESVPGHGIRLSIDTA